MAAIRRAARSFHWRLNNTLDLVLGNFATSSIEHHMESSIIRFEHEVLGSFLMTGVLNSHRKHGPISIILLCFLLCIAARHSPSGLTSKQE
ncbi:hypothetical protein BCR37DRAFT_382142 [Protomyces lactucae-debilis]|uniref:Uncharacterized protein n=1 Tax=Protomyces lactucae-debilis TaxID=2754530 RepID=A0A1Y2F6E1_PROLT|nr:uncharacterized protein BCR37DRAFT_382142 [Protomyces lactucae-debilis]ORY78505.1 hypothetical protein BCR37DRAFT_382142 [Protomyces lactucae-debilis]